MRIEEIFEATVIGNNHSEPLKDSDTIRVYHGTSDPNFLLTAVTKGLSGGMRANRRYSYEANNNPKGLFVTPDLKTAKDFGSYIIEFHTRVRDLESPVWPNGTFTGQGQMSGVFGDDADRERERIRQRMNWSESEFEFVRNSSRPEVAAMLLVSGERQALFTGDLNRNSIRAVWVSSDPTRINQPYERLHPRELLKRVKDEGLMDRFGSRVGGVDKESEIFKNINGKLVQPRDDVSFEDLVMAVKRKRPFVDEETIRNVLRDNEDYIRRYVWSDRQFNQVIRTMR